ncbi:hypothetical protein HW49_09860 [Porphyromonadaceae bacterium COT-184 OH4590]|nr:hypothetical protein HW49_09860 [Porphyromonadaceae bacterium COT-184 OH4590]
MDKKIIVAVDFGNNKLSIAVAYKHPDNSLELIDYRQREFLKLTANGIIQNPNNILTEINSCLQQIENENNIKIGAYWFGLEPYTLRSEIRSVACKYNGNIVDSIKQLENEVGQSVVADNRKILVSEMLSTKQGANMQGDFLVVSTTDDVKRQIEKIINNFSTERKVQFKLSPMVEAGVFLSDAQKEVGTLLIDFGADVTSFTIYREGMPCFIAVLPVGGQHITQDIAVRFGLEFKIAEQLKIELGIASADFVTEDKHYSIQQTVKLSLIELVNTIEARQCEIIDFIMSEIDRQGLSSHYETIVVTGGASNLKFLPELLQKQTDKQVIKLFEKNLQKGDKILDNTLLIALLQHINDDCRAIAKEKPSETLNAASTQKPVNQPNKPKKSFWNKFSGVADMFNEENEKPIS